MSCLVFVAVVAILLYFSGVLSLASSVEVVIGLAILFFAFSVLAGGINIIAIFSWLKNNFSTQPETHISIESNEDNVLNHTENNLAELESNRNYREQQEPGDYKNIYAQGKAVEKPFASIFDHEDPQEDETAEGLGIGEIAIEDVDNERE